MSMSKGKKWLLIIGGLVCAGAIVCGGVFAWRSHVVKSIEQRNYAEASELIAKGQGAEALQIINRRNRSTTKQSEKTRLTWLSLEIDALAQANHLPRLLAIYERSPELFAQREAATLSVARALMHAGNAEAFDKLRGEWKSRETNAPGWFEVDVDALLLRGRRDEAIKMLNSRTFEGPADCGRLGRLAMVNTPGDLSAAWKYLDRAAMLNPHNPDIRLFRGQILEGVGQIPGANVEYRAAFDANINSAFFRDHLAEFYRRNGGYDMAVLTWANGLTNQSTTDLIWLRTLFWTKTTRTIKFDFSAVEPPFGPIKPFVQYLIALPPGKFWDEAAFTKTAEARRYEQQLQDVFWLRLLDELQNGKEDEAMKLLEFNRFRENSWNRDLESALLRVMVYRKSGELRLPVGVNLPLSTAPLKSRHELLEKLDALTKTPKEKPSPELDKLLRGKNAFAAVFLASGWAEAALNLPHDEVMPEGSPDWLAYGFTQATRFNRGPAAGAEFAARQKSSPTLELLKAQILMDEGKTDEALSKLAPLATTASDVGATAAEITATIRLRQKQYSEAKAAVMAAPEYSKGVPGREMLARIALAENKTDEAAKIYSSIEAESDEAKMFLAKQAFEAKDWTRARKLTEQLAKKYPERGQLRANLDAIAKAEGAK